MDNNEKIINIVYILFGTCGLLFSRHYSGPMENFFHSYVANITFSFGGYFLLKFFKLPLINNKYINAVYTLVGVSLQEIAQGLGFYPGTFDQHDFLFNTIGIVFALGIDILRLRKKVLRKMTS